MKKDTAILILSCDKYADAWMPFFTLFYKFWPDCPYPVYLGTNELDFSFEGVCTIRSGKARDWSSDTAAILSQLNEEYVLVLLEDYFLTHRIDSVLLEKCIALVQETGAVFMRLASFRSDHFSMYPYDIIPEHPYAGITRPAAPFRINLQAGIWEKKGFMDLLVKGESPWEFEVKGSERTRNSERTFLGLVDDPRESYVHGPVPYLCTAITKGVWMREAIELCEKEGVALDLSKRAVESKIEFTKRRIYHGLPFGMRKYVDFISGKIFRKKKS